MDGGREYARSGTLVMSGLLDIARLVEGLGYWFVVESPGPIRSSGTLHHLQSRGFDLATAYDGDVNRVAEGQGGVAGWLSSWPLICRREMTVLAAKQNFEFAAMQGAGVRLRDSWVTVYGSEYREPGVFERAANAGRQFGNDVAQAAGDALEATILTLAVYGIIGAAALWVVLKR